MSRNSLQSLITAIDQSLAQEKSASKPSRGGIVRSAKDGIIEIIGLPGLSLGEVLMIEEADARALVMNIEADGGLAVVLNNSQRVKEGQAATQSGATLSVPVGDEMLGRVVDPMGRSMDEGKPLSTKQMRPIEQIAPDVMSRSPVETPVQTGILAIDALIPIGRGQRELIIGDRQTGKTTIAIDTIINQKDQNMVCVYVAIGQRESKTAEVVRTLRDHGALDYTVVVSSGASSPAIMQFLAPYSGCAIAEHFLHQGKDVLVVYDDLSKHAVAYRELSLLLRTPPGREAYPGDVFYLHSRLLERAVKLDEKLGGGSITALPIVETQAGDVSAYIPTNVISITDGQIFLDTTLFYRGIRPAINVGISVSRVGSAAQTNIMKKTSGTTKLDLAQFNELAAFSQFASELDDSTKQQLTRGQRTVEALKQKAHKPLSLWKEVATLWAAKEGALDNVEPQEVRKFIELFLIHLETHEAELIDAIQKGQKLTDEVAVALKAAIKRFFQSN